jgi:hypothetical protein
MTRTANIDNALLEAVKVTRLREKEAKQIAKRELMFMIDKQTKGAHEDLLVAIRNAVLGGQSARQIGIAYGTTDPYTIRNLIAEATNGIDGANNGDHPDWLLRRFEDGTFEVQALALGSGDLSGTAIFSVDEDGENFTALSGDLWIQVQLYKLGYKDKVMEEYNNAR